MRVRARGYLRDGIGKAKMNMEPEKFDIQVRSVIKNYTILCLSGAVGSVGVWCSARRCCRGRGFESR